MDRFKILMLIRNELISSSWFDSAGDLPVQGTTVGGVLRSKGSLVPVWANEVGTESAG
jgi:hypothetical protein